MELVASLTSAADSPALPALASRAGWLEVRADLLTGTGLPELLAGFGGKTIFTLRSTREGGAFDGSAAERQDRLIAAAAHFDAVDLEAETDLGKAVLERIPPERRVLSWHGEARSAGALVEQLAQMRATPAWRYKLVPTAVRPGDGIGPLELLRRSGTGDVVAFAAGAAGAWTRPISVAMGAPLAFAYAGERAAAPGQPGLDAFLADYAPFVRGVEAIFGVVGRPVSHSLSPRLHNAAYRELGLPFLFVAFEGDTLSDVWRDLVRSEALEDLGFPIRGLAVTAPFKEEALAVAEAVDESARAVGGGNTLMSGKDGWRLASTDGEGVVQPLRRRGLEIGSRRALVVGAGGAGRAAVRALQGAGASVLMTNRSAERGEKAAGRLGVPFRESHAVDLEEVDILVNATAVPAYRLWLDLGRLKRGAALVDLVYEHEGPVGRSSPTRSDLLFVEGREVLLAQARPQFQRMTGHALPEAVGRAALGLPAEGEDRMS